METPKKPRPKTAEEIRMENLQKSKKMWYQEPPADITMAVDQARKRVRQWTGKKSFFAKDKTIERLPKDIYLDLIGELRSAESRKRISTFEHHMTKIKKIRTQHLVNQQPNAVEAIRLKGLLKEDQFVQRHLAVKFLNLVERRRVEQLVGMDIRALL